MIKPNSNYVKFMAALPASADEVQSRTGMGKSLMRGVLSKARKAGDVHVLRWVYGKNGQAAAIYCAGPGESAPRPEVKPSSVSSFEYREARLKRDTVSHPGMTDGVAESIVACAMRTQPKPNWVFALGAMA